MHHAGHLAWQNLHFGGRRRMIRLRANVIRSRPSAQGVAMLRTVALAAAFAAAQVVFTAALVAETEFATPEEAKALLEKAVVAIEAGRGKSAREVRQWRGRV